MIVIVEAPAGVDERVVIVIVELHVGLHDTGLNEHVAPAGRPEHV